jgi:hypothetical protein
VNKLLKNIRLVRQKFTKISEECTASIFRVEKQTVQNAKLCYKGYAYRLR